MQSRTILFVSVVALVALVSQAAAFRNQSVILGYRQMGDSLRATKFASMGARRGQVVVYNFNYPEGPVRQERITQIQVLDQWNNGTNGNVFLNSGGSGYKTASLSIRSVLHFGLNYRINVYAAPCRGPC